MKRRSLQAARTMTSSSRETPRSLCWFRSDLRTEDQPALAAALQNGPASALFIITPAQWQAHHDAPIKVDFRLRALHSLKADLAELGVALDCLVIDHWRDIPAALVRYCQQHGIEQVHCNREPGVNERRRDRACFTELQNQGITLVGHEADTLLKPGTVKTGSGDYYRVFTPFARRCRDLLRERPYTLTPRPTAQPPLNRAVNPIPDALPGWSVPTPEQQALWPATCSHAHHQLGQFIDTTLHGYDQTRDFPARRGTSSLSPYLALGLVSAGQCLHAALQANQGELDSGSAGARAWINELLWREFYRHLLFGFPALSMHQPMKPETAGVAWRNAPDDLAAWQTGHTGIPIVDAAMRQLLATGWMHNRLRMITAMFLTKNLLIDWRLGEAFFMQHLIDGDLASNNGGRQWSASTGADAAPYFRVFNPVSQSEKFDPEGRFLMKWLPELATLPAKQRHDPPADVRNRVGYPQAIVDLKSSRQRAIDAFAAL